jgi:hypothetical protein
VQHPVVLTDRRSHSLTPHHPTALELDTNAPATRADAAFGEYHTIQTFSLRIVTGVVRTLGAGSGPLLLTNHRSWSLNASLDPSVSRFGWRQLGTFARQEVCLAERSPSWCLRSLARSESGTSAPFSSLDLQRCHPVGRILLKSNWHVVHFAMRPIQEVPSDPYQRAGGIKVAYEENGKLCFW